MRSSRLCNIWIAGIIAHAVDRGVIGAAALPRPVATSGGGTKLRARNNSKISHIFAHKTYRVVGVQNATLPAICTAMLRERLIHLFGYVEKFVLPDGRTSGAD